MKDKSKKVESRRRCEFQVEGMHCSACELLIEKKLENNSDVKFVDARLSDNKLIVETTSSKSDNELAKEFDNLVKENGYRIINKDSKLEKNDIGNYKSLIFPLLIALPIFLLFLLLTRSGLVESVNLDSSSFAFDFFLGVIASLSTCMATVGGLVLTLSTKFSEGKKILPIILFHIARIIGFFILGGVIGYAGSIFKLSITASLILNVLLALVMIVMGFDLLRIFSFTKKLQPHLPKSFGKGVMRFSEGTNLIAPIILGVLTFFLPCGFTQNRQLAALVSGNFISGATTMLIFALGTLPVLAVISFVSVKFSKSKFAGYFFKVSGFLIIFFAIMQLIAALTASGIIPPMGI
ncbi:MAG: sulfite exporter TauE/SafE family protein [bacterium]